MNDPNSFSDEELALLEEIKILAAVACSTATRSGMPPNSTPKRECVWKKLASIFQIMSKLDLEEIMSKLDLEDRNDP